MINKKYLAPDRRFHHVYYYMLAAFLTYELLVFLIWLNAVSKGIH